MQQHFSQQLQQLQVNQKNKLKKLNQSQQNNRPNNASSISEYNQNNDSFILTSILEVLKTEQYGQHDTGHDQLQKTHEFIQRMHNHLIELCLTKMSVKHVENLTQIYHSQVDSNSQDLRGVLINYFKEIIPEIEHLLGRLRQINHKKFQNLIKRKISDIFSQIMRQAYDIKMFVIVEKMEQKRRNMKIAYVFDNIRHIIPIRKSLRAGFDRIRAIYRQSKKNKFMFYKKCEQSLGILNKLAYRRNYKVKSGYFHLWHTHSKGHSFWMNKQIGNIIKNIYVDLIQVMQSQSRIHEIINSTLMKLSDVENTYFCYYRSVENLLVHYNSIYKQQNDVAISSIQSEGIIQMDIQQQKGLQELQKQPPFLVNGTLYSEKIIDKPSPEQTKCLKQKQIVTYEEYFSQVDRKFSIMLIPIFTVEGETIGLFKLVLAEQISVRYLQNVLSFAKNIGNIINKIYGIKLRVDYYEKDCRSINQISRKMFAKYSQINDYNYKQKLNQLFQEIQMDNIEIIFFNQENTENFYTFVKTGSKSYLQLTNTAVKVFKDQFEKKDDNRQQKKSFLTINRNNQQFIIFPIYKNLIIKGFIKFFYSFQVPIQNFVELLKVFIQILTIKIFSFKIQQQDQEQIFDEKLNRNIVLEEKQKIQKRIEKQKQQKDPIQILENCLQILNCETFEALQDSVNCTLKRIGGAFNYNYYSIILWPVIRNKQLKYFWIHQQDKLVQFEVRSNIITNLIRSPNLYQTQILSSSDPIVELLKKFPLYQNFKIDQYQNFDKNYRVVSLPIRNKANQIICVLVIGNIHKPINQFRNNNSVYLSTAEGINQLGAGSLSCDMSNILQLAQYIRLRGKIQIQSKGLEFQQEYERRIQNSFYSITSGYQIDYQNFWQSIANLMNTLYAKSKTTVYKRISKYYIIQLLSKQKIEIPIEEEQFFRIPNNIICSHNHFTFLQYYIKYQNKIILNEKKVSLNFKSGLLRQNYFEFLRNAFTEEKNIIMDAPNQLKNFTNVIQLPENYLIIPIAENIFLQIESLRKWTFTQSNLLRIYLQTQFKKYMNIQTTIKHKKKEYLLSKLIQDQWIKAPYLIKQVIHKFKQNFSVINLKQNKLRKILSMSLNLSDYKLKMHYTFNKFKQSKTQYQSLKDYYKDKCILFSQKINKVYKKDIFKKIFVNFHQKLKQDNKIQQKFKKIQKIKLRLEKYYKNKFITNFLIFTFNQKKCEVIKQKQCLQKIFGLFQKKIMILTKTVLCTIYSKKKQFLSFFTIISQQIDLVRFNWQKQLLEFLKQRITLPLGRLNKPFEGIIMTFRIIKQKNLSTKFKTKNQLDYSTNLQLKEIMAISTPRTEQNFEGDTIGIDNLAWKLNANSLLICSFSKKIKFQGEIRDKLIQIFNKISKSHEQILKNLYRRISSLNSTFKYYEKKIFQCGFSMLQRNLRKVYRQQNKKSKNAIKQIEGRLEDCLRESEINKQNDGLNHTLNKYKKQVAAMEQSFEELKIENKIKRKTLSVSLMLIKTLQQNLMHEKARIFLYKIDTQNKLLITRQQKCLEQNLNKRKIESGGLILKRVLKVQILKKQKICFQRLLHKAFTFSQLR